MRLAERKLCGSTGITYDTEQQERILALRGKIIQKMRHMFGISMSDIMAAMLDAEGVAQGRWKESWEDIPKQLGKPKPADWVPKALGDVAMSEVLGYPWGSRPIVSNLTRERVHELVEEADMGDVFLIRKCGTLGSRSARISVKQRERLRILGRKRKIWKTSDIITYLLDRAGIKYGPQIDSRARAIAMLEREVAHASGARGVMSDMPPITPEQEAEHTVDTAMYAAHMAGVESSAAPEQVADPPLARATPGGPIESQVTEEPKPDIGHTSDSPSHTAEETT